MYKCYECNYESHNKTNYERHLSSNKHKEQADSFFQLKREIEKKFKKLDESNKKLEESNKKLEKEVKELKSELSRQVSIQGNHNSHSTTTNSYNTNNTNNNYNITVVPYSDTDYTCLTKQDVIEAMSKDDYYLSHLFKKIHVDNPKNRNLYLRTKKSKEIYMYRGENEWEPCDVDKVLYGITMRCENACDDALEKNGLMEEYDSKINQYVDKRELDENYQKKIYNKFHDVLYMYKNKMIP